MKTSMNYSLNKSSVSLAILILFLVINSSIANNLLFIKQTSKQENKNYRNEKINNEKKEVTKDEEFKRYSEKQHLKNNRISILGTDLNSLNSLNSEFPGKLSLNVYENNYHPNIHNDNIKNIHSYNNDTSIVNNKNSGNKIQGVDLSYLSEYLNDYSRNESDEDSKNGFENLIVSSLINKNSEDSNDNGKDDSLGFLSNMLKEIIGEDSKRNKDNKINVNHLYSNTSDINLDKSGDFQDSYYKRNYNYDANTNNQNTNKTEDKAEDSQENDNNETSGTSFDNKGNEKRDDKNVDNDSEKNKDEISKTNIEDKNKNEAKSKINKSRKSKALLKNNNHRVLPVTEGNHNFDLFEATDYNNYFKNKKLNNNNNDVNDDDVNKKSKINQNKEIKFNNKLEVNNSMLNNTINNALYNDLYYDLDNTYEVKKHSINNFTAVQNDNLNKTNTSSLNSSVMKIKIKEEDSDCASKNQLKKVRKVLDSHSNILSNIHELLKDNKKIKDKEEKNENKDHVLYYNVDNTKTMSKAIKNSKDLNRNKYNQLNHLPVEHVETIYQAKPYVLSNYNAYAYNVEPNNNYSFLNNIIEKREMSQQLKLNKINYINKLISELEEEDKQTLYNTNTKNLNAYYPSNEKIFIPIPVTNSSKDYIRQYSNTNNNKNKQNYSLLTSSLLNNINKKRERNIALNKKILISLQKRRIDKKNK